MATGRFIPVSQLSSEQESRSASKEIGSAATSATTDLPPCTDLEAGFCDGSATLQRSNLPGMVKCRFVKVTNSDQLDRITGAGTSSSSTNDGLSESPRSGLHEEKCEWFSVGSNSTLDATSFSRDASHRTFDDASMYSHWDSAQLERGSELHLSGRDAVAFDALSIGQQVHDALLAEVSSSLESAFQVTGGLCAAAYHTEVLPGRQTPRSSSSLDVFRDGPVATPTFQDQLRIERLGGTEAEADLRRVCEDGVEAFHERGIADAWEKLRRNLCVLDRDIISLGVATLKAKNINEALAEQEGSELLGRQFELLEFANLFQR